MTEDAPQTAGQRYPRSIAEQVGRSIPAVGVAGCTATLTEAAKALSPAVQSAVGAGVAGQTARDLFPGSPWAEGLAELAGGLGPLGASAAMPKRVSTAPSINALKDHTLLDDHAGKMYDLPTESVPGKAYYNDAVSDQFPSPGTQHPGGYDPEGRPLVARYVVGQAERGGVEAFLPSEAIADLATAKTRDGFVGDAPPTSLGKGSVGTFEFNRITGQPPSIKVAAGLDEPLRRQVTLHEGGHLIDHLAKSLPRAGITKDLESIYHYGRANEAFPARKQNLVRAIRP